MLYNLIIECFLSLIKKFYKVFTHLIMSSGRISICIKTVLCKEEWTTVDVVFVSVRTELSLAKETPECHKSVSLFPLKVVPVWDLSQNGCVR